MARFLKGSLICSTFLYSITCRKGATVVQTQFQSYNYSIAMIQIQCRVSFTKYLTGLPQNIVFFAAVPCYLSCRKEPQQFSHWSNHQVCCFILTNKHLHNTSLNIKHVGQDMGSPWRGSLRDHLQHISLQYHLQKRSNSSSNLVSITQLQCCNDRTTVHSVAHKVSDRLATESGLPLERFLIISPQQFSQQHTW